MKVGIGFSENPDTRLAGIEVARAALLDGDREADCDLVLLFGTARHDAALLREAVSSVTGAGARIFGGAAVGAITDKRIGYAGDQVIMAAIWLEGSQCGVFAEGGLAEDEFASGKRLGKQLLAAGIDQGSQIMLFYDAINRKGDDVRLVMATYLLAGLEEELGFLPERLTGAGLQGDYVCTPTGMQLGDRVGAHHAIALAFGGDLRVDNVILHGCRPASGYYTVTKTDRQTILEINGEPALPFIESLLGPNMSADELPFFLILGVNKGDKWADFDENLYANRLCLAIDRERNGIVMFEPDMVEGTEFQIMQRGLDLGYMAPKIEDLFAGLEGREPVFAMYIDCAGRAAGYAGIDVEDAEVVRELAAANKVPLMGLYTGVEIAPVQGRPRGLDWTGVFCLFSLPKK